MSETNDPNSFAIIGLGKIGGNLAAQALEVPIPVIGRSVMQLFASRDDGRPGSRVGELWRGRPFPSR